jgi:hypothetical protein
MCKQGAANLPTCGSDAVAMLPVTIVVTVAFPFALNSTEDVVNEKNKYTLNCLFAACNKGRKETCTTFVLVAIFGQLK